MESQVENIRKVQAIIGADYSEYPKPLRELLEYRKEAYKAREKALETEHFDALIEYCEKQIKSILVL